MCYRLSYYCKPLFLFVLLNIIFISVQAQIRYKGPGEGKWWKWDGQDLYLKDTTIICDHFGELLVGDNEVKDSLVKDGNDYWMIKARLSFNIENCLLLDSLAVFDESNVDEQQRRLDGGIRVNDLFVKECRSTGKFYLPGLNVGSGGAVVLQNSTFDHIALRNPFMRMFDAACVSFNEFESAYGAYEAVTFSSIRAPLGRQAISFQGASIRTAFTFSGDSACTVEINMRSDSIDAYVEISDTVFTGSNAHLTCLFYDTWINGEVHCPSIKKRSKLDFENCSFGPHASLSNLDFDTIIFNRCSISNGGLFMNLATNKPVYVSFVDMDVAKLKFNFTENIHLFFDKNVYRDYVTSTYESLLAKFKEEGKSESYKNVDIAYQEQSHGCLVNTLIFLWWNYGYSKSYILIWTLVFLVLFHVANSLNWDKIHEVYTVVPNKTSSGQKDKGFSKQLKVFIYTSYIFFSLRMDFSKVEYKQNGLLFLLFFQYVTGLTCLFFIANAILKLG